MRQSLIHDITQLRSKFPLPSPLAKLLPHPSPPPLTAWSCEVTAEVERQKSGGGIEKNIKVSISMSSETLDCSLWLVYLLDCKYFVWRTSTRLPSNFWLSYEYHKEIVQKLRLGKNKLHELRGVPLFFGFSAKFVNISAIFGFLNMQIRSNFTNVVFIATKWCKIFKYTVNIMVISYSYCQKRRRKKRHLG